MRTDDIRRFARKLEEALGDRQGFEEIFSELKKSDLSVGEVKAVSKQFAGKSGSSKSAAMEAIWARHQSLMNARTKARATGDRTAA